MSEENAISLNIEFPPGMVKPIPHYTDTRDLAIDLVVLLLALPNFPSVLDDVSLQSESQDGYVRATRILSAIMSARNVLLEEAPELVVVADTLGKSMDNWGPALTALNFLIIQYPDSAGKVISGYIKDYSRNELAEKE